MNLPGVLLLALVLVFDFFLRRKDGVVVAEMHFESSEPGSVHFASASY